MFANLFSRGLVCCKITVICEQTQNKDETATPDTGLSLQLTEYRRLGSQCARHKL